jgi:hypothetical protein
MDRLVTNNHANRAEVQSVLLLPAKEWKLQNSGREVDGVHLRIFVSDASWRGHQPFGTVDGFADLIQFQLAMYFKSGCRVHVRQVVPDRVSPTLVLAISAGMGWAAIHFEQVY